ncbi:restriction endonuclease subunit S [Acidihalobacter ferrooxydans]|uniref:Type I restriction modification DNA specificity domain-containing protein n=1 Tax=Acidihalobacter ferrooxydans TaxID=1765967 RepID=A0A1P8UGZ1_9GAMM|nr:restriction endonuclease subunit S [Acidihalobacter ferrooxydans]APZ43102.1 hypothetical protein BW247_08380 [Acidihalobacter ferrooxydans]
MSQLETVELESVGRIVTGKTPPSSIEGAFGGDVPFITPSDMDGRKWIDTTDRYLTEVGVSTVKSSLVPKGAVAVSCIGSDMGKVVMVAKDSVTNQQINSIIVDEARYVPEYIYYVLLPRQKELKDLASGSATPILSKGLFSRVTVDLLPFHSQQAIAEILSSLDEKIELNRKQNRSLEAIAQALFKRWFVEFEFPDENGRPYRSSGGAMQPSELGEIPVGWEVGCIGDFVEHKKDGINPGDQPDELFFHFSIPNFDDGQAAKPELGGTILSNKYLVAPDSILVSKLNPRFPRIWPVFGVPGERSVCSTEFQVLSPGEGAFGFVLCLLKSPLVASEMVSRASGTSGSHQRINPDDLLSIEVIKPMEDVIERFHLAVLDGIRKAQANLEQNRVLGEVRDTLLPKLMSGELRVA